MVKSNEAPNTASAKSLAPAIAKALGKEWVVTSVRVDDERVDDNHVRLQHTSGAHVHLATDRYGRSKGRVEIRGWGPANDRQIYLTDTHEISVSASRAPEVIAREIARRLLPDYMRDYAATAARIAREEASDDLGQRDAETLRRRGGSGKPAWQSRKGEAWQFYCPNGQGKVYRYTDDAGPRISLDLSGLTLECASAILDVLAHHGPEENE